MREQCDRTLCLDEMLTQQIPIVFGEAGRLDAVHPEIEIGMDPHVPGLQRVHIGLHVADLAMQLQNESEEGEIKGEMLHKRREGLEFGGKRVGHAYMTPYEGCEASGLGSGKARTARDERLISQECSMFRQGVLHGCYSVRGISRMSGHAGTMKITDVVTWRGNKEMVGIATRGVMAPVTHIKLSLAAFASLLDMETR